MSPGRSRSSVPLGPFTVTWRPTMVTSTPLGTGMGVSPIRDSSSLPSPHVAEDLAAHAALARLAVGHEPPGWSRGRPRRGHRGLAGPGRTWRTPQAGLRTPGAGRRWQRCALGRVLHPDVSTRPGRSAGGSTLAAVDVALLLEDARARASFRLERRHAHRRRASRRWRCGCASACRRSGSVMVIGRPPHQLALVTPGTSPACTSSRRQMRHRPNLRYTGSAAGRTRWQRRVRPHLELALALLLLRSAPSWPSGLCSLTPEREAEGVERGLCVPRSSLSRGRHDRDVHAAGASTLS